MAEIKDVVVPDQVINVSTCNMTDGEPEAMDIVKQVMTQGYSLFYYKRVNWNAKGDRFSDVIHFPQNNYATMLNEGLNFLSILYRRGLVGFKTGTEIGLSWGCTGVFKMPICMDEMKVIAKPIPPVAATVRIPDYKMLYEEQLKKIEDLKKQTEESNKQTARLEEQIKQILNQPITSLSNQDHQIRILEDVKKDITPEEQKLVDTDALFHHVDNVRHLYELVGKTVPHWYVKQYGHFFGLPGNEEFRNIGVNKPDGGRLAFYLESQLKQNEERAKKEDILPFGKPSQFEIVECDDDDNEFPTIIKPKNEEEAKVLYAPRNITGVERGCEGGSCGG